MQESTTPIMALAHDRPALSCSSHTTRRSDPLVAHCVTGALRSLPERRVFGSLREKLLDAFSARYTVFFVVSFDCRVGTHAYVNATTREAACARDYSTRDIDRALAFVGAESFEVVPNRAPPAASCATDRGALERSPSYWLQQHKTRRCFEAVERHERESGTCFDWVVRSRPDDLWKARVPPAASLPRDAVTVGSTWPWFAPLQYWERTNYSAMDDHFMAAPRQLADTALKHALAGWFDCRPPREYVARCPPQMLHYLREHGLADKAVLTSECMLGLHLRTRGVRWRTDGRFQYVMRRVPGGPANESYSRTLATYPMHLRERMREYQRRESAVERHRWGEALSEDEEAPGGGDADG